MESSKLDNAALEKEHEKEEENRKQKRKKRSKDEIRNEWVERVKSGFRSYHGRLYEISQASKSSEEEIRRWCIDVIKMDLGYNDNEIDTEVRVLGQRVDIALKKDDRIFIVIECKNIRHGLNSSVRDQAVAYATSLSANWAAITNGQIWKLFRVVPEQGKDPRVIEVFNVAILDDDGVSDCDAEMLYLLTARAIFMGDSDKTFHQVAATSPRRLLKALSSDRVIKAIRMQLSEDYKMETEESIKLEDDYISELIQETFEQIEI